MVDISGGASLSVPDASGRYMSVMVISEDGYLNRVFHEAGEYPLTVDRVRYLLRHRRGPHAGGPDRSEGSCRRPRHPRRPLAQCLRQRPQAYRQYDEDSYEATKKPLLELTDGIGDTRGMFGTLDVVEPERFVVG